MALLLDLEFIIVIILGGIVILLILVFLIAMLIFMKKRRMMCFGRDAAAKPFVVTDKQLEAGWRGRQRQKSRPFSQARPSHAKPKGKRGKRGKVGGRYTPLRGSPAAPKKDPFAKGFLENPMVDDEELDVDWTNPAFDENRARLYDAAVSIQCWYRMVRWVICI